jgi:hypothetical protein
MKKRSPYKYQYDGDTLIMNGWCGLNNTEQQWLIQLEHCAHALADKMVGQLLNAPDDCVNIIHNYHNSIKNVQCEIDRLKSRANARYELKN